MIGTEIGNFKVTEKLGEGGMGEVYLAEQKNIKTRVAIKTLRPQISSNREYVQRFFNEAVAVSRIKHSGIAKIFDVGFLPAGQAYLVMEFLEGETLASLIRRIGPLPLAQVAELARQIANVLEATHQAGITHRDLKPENIFLVPDAELEGGERVKVLDFGIAKLGGGATLTHSSVGSMGTPAYMAPEQWRDAKAVDWRADAYSLGCIAFEMAAGRPPFVVESIAEACMKHLSAPPPSLASLVPHTPRALDGLVAALLEKDPARRPATMKEVTRQFAALLRDPAAALAPAIAPSLPPVPSHTTPLLVSDTTLGHASSSMERRRGGSNKLVWGLLGSIGVIAIAAIVLALWFHRNSEDIVPGADLQAAGKPEANRDAGTRGVIETALARAPGQGERPVVGALASQDAGISEADGSARVRAEPTGRERAKGSSTAEAPKPETLGMDAVYAVYSRSGAQLGGCLQSTGSETAHIAIVIDGPTGRTTDVTVNDQASGALWACVDRVMRAMQFPTIHGPRTRAAFDITMPASAASSTSSTASGCDEVSCVLDNYQGPCCARFKKGGHGTVTAPPPRPNPDALPEELDRAMVSAGIAGVRGRVMACADHSPARGVVKVHVKVGGDGRVTSVSASESPDPALGACVEAAVQHATFARTLNGGSFLYPFMF